MPNKSSDPLTKVVLHPVRVPTVRMALLQATALPLTTGQSLTVRTTAIQSYTNSVVCAARHTNPLHMGPANGCPVPCSHHFDHLVSLLKDVTVGLQQNVLCSRQEVDQTTTPFILP